MTIFERGLSAVLTVFAFSSMSASRRSAIQLVGKQQINNLWPARFVKDKICEKRARNIPDADAGERWLRKSDCLTLGMFLDDMLSCMRIRQETAFILSFVPSLQSASCSLCWRIGVACDVSDSIFPQATFHSLFILVPIRLCSNKKVLVIKGHSR